VSSAAFAAHQLVQQCPIERQQGRALLGPRRILAVHVVDHEPELERRREW